MKEVAEEALHRLVVDVAADHDELAAVGGVLAGVPIEWTYSRYMIYLVLLLLLSRRGTSSIVYLISA